jgi:Uma2 family endonuclease
MRTGRRRYAYTYGDYLMLEAEAPALRHEFIDGEIVAMGGGSELHSAVISALSGELYVQLRGTTFGLRESNLRVRIQATGNAFYADALVVCGNSEIVREIRGGDSLLNPTVIVEVLSPSTEDYDRGAKFDDDYRFIPSLREYVLVAQDEPRVEVRSRDADGNWTTLVYREGQQAALGAILATIDVEAVYREAKKNASKEPR